MEAIVSVQYKEEQRVGDDQEVFTGAIWVKFWEVERCRRWPGSIHWSSPSEILSRRWSRIRWRSPSENRRSNDERWVLEKNLVGVERGRRWSGFHWSSPSENRRCNDERWVLEKNLVGVERGRRWSSVNWSSPSENRRSNDERWVLEKNLVGVERGRRWSGFHWSSPSENRRCNDERWVLEKNLVGVERGRRWSGFHWSSPSENRRCNDERHGSSWSGDSLWIYLFVQVSRPPDKNTLSLTSFWALATSFWAIATSFWQLQLIILALSFLGASAMRAFSLVSLSSNDPKIKQLEKFCREVLSGFPYHRQTDEGQKQSMAL